MTGQILARLDADPDLPAPVYRTARRLLDRIGADGRTTLRRDELQQISGCTHPGALRKQLRAIEAAAVATITTAGDLIVVDWSTAPNGRVAIESAPNGRVDSTPNAPVGRAEEGASAPNGRENAPNGRENAPNGRATSHAGARALVGCLVDHFPDQEEIQTTNQPEPPGAPIRRVDTEASLRLLTTVGVALNVARPLAAAQPFEFVRRAVAQWYTSRKCNGGRYQDGPGIVVAWLRNPASAGIGPLPAAWWSTDLAPQFMTPEEEEAAAAALPPTPLPPPPPPALPAKGDTWARLLAELEVNAPHLAKPLRGARLEDTGDAPLGKPVWRIVMDPSARDQMGWIKKQGDAALRRSLSSLLGKPVICLITVEEEATPLC